MFSLGDEFARIHSLTQFPGGSEGQPFHLGHAFDEPGGGDQDDHCGARAQDGNLVEPGAAQGERDRAEINSRPPAPKPRHGKMDSRRAGIVTDFARGQDGFFQADADTNKPGPVQGRYLMEFKADSNASLGSKSFGSW